MNKILAVLLVVAGAALARAEVPVVAGVVASVEGKPQVLRVDGKAPRPLKLNDILNEGDTVITGRSARVGVAFVGGAELRVNENSSFKMESGGGDKQPTSVFTTLGNAWTRLLKGNARIQVRTPAAVCAVRGTEADVNFGSGAMTVKVYEGHVNVNNPGNAQGVDLVQGQLTQVVRAAGGTWQAPQAPRVMTPQDYATWQNSLKPANLPKSLQLLQTAADKNRTLNIQMKDRDGKTKNVRLNFEKK